MPPLFLSNRYKTKNIAADKLYPIRDAFTPSLAQNAEEERISA
jgi:hypothetical protein